MKRIFRTKKGKKEDTFTIISNNILNSDLSADAIYVMIQVLKKPNYWKFYINKFAPEIKFGERRLRTAITELIEKGYCIKKTISKRQTEYEFYESNKLNPEFNNNISICSTDSSDLQF